ncbi:MAG: VRR-NUC domain-containing protein [Nocardioidaceae bacterium]
MTERQLLDALRDACKWAGLLVYHTHDSRRSERGYPDLCIVGPVGLLFRELKAERGRLTTDQQLWLDRLTEAGANAAVWRPADWSDRVLVELANIGGCGLPPNIHGREQFARSAS